MSGGGKTDDTTANTAAASTAVAPQVINFGTQDNSALLKQQLQSGGLLSAVGNPSLLYSAVSAPIITSPGQLHKWMLSQGLKVLDAEGVDTGGSTASPSTSTGGTGTKQGVSPFYNPGLNVRYGAKS